MFGPECLRAVGGLDDPVGLGVRMSCGVGGGEGDVLGGVPVLGEDDVVELFARALMRGLRRRRL
ncbi:hypothetical protein [Tunturiibacter gelidiferens]|uniref:hypothetical protein n=1 Tax=Tunturiibacter gelidiferens TaxID=3069689 RepID=UPI003D9AB828